MLLSDVCVCVFFFVFISYIECPFLGGAYAEIESPISWCLHVRFLTQNNVRTLMQSTHGRLHTMVTCHGSGCGVLLGELNNAECMHLLSNVDLANDFEFVSREAKIVTH